MKKLLFALSFFFASMGFATVQDSIGTVTKDGKQYTKYLVTPGETVYRISTTNNVSITQLMTDNPDLEYGLKVGQVILLQKFVRTSSEQKVIVKSPFEPKVTSPNKASNHVVQKGETYYGLSKKYGIPLNTLLEWNGAGLKEGQTLNLSNPKEEKTVATTKKVNSGAIMQKEEPKKEVVKKEVIQEPKKEVVVKKEEVQKIKAETVMVPDKEVKKITPKEEEVKKEEPKKEITKATPVAVAAAPKVEEIVAQEELYEYDVNKQQVLFVPFDPHLYWSDADEEIRRGSKLKTRLEVRKTIRRRLNALLDPMGYENIHLLGGRFRDTLTDLNKIYSSVSYDYQTAIVSEQYKESLAKQEAGNKKSGEVAADKSVKTKFNNLRDRLANQTTEEETKLDKHADKYFGVIIKDPKFFEYFNHKYNVDYYVFINQFEVITDYDHCLDRTTENYRRYFVVHYSIFNLNGKQIAGNKYKQFYDSNSNNIDRITGDNLQGMADRILMELPLPR